MYETRAVDSALNKACMCLVSALPGMDGRTDLLSLYEDVNGGPRPSSRAHPDALVIVSLPAPGLLRVRLLL